MDSLQAVCRGDFEASEDTRDIKNPVFSAVTIDQADRSYDTQAASPAVTTDERVRFLGTYKRTTFDATDNSILFLGGANTLFYPQSGATIGAQRAYFKIGDAALARQLTAFNIDFGDEATGIKEFDGPTSSPSPARPEGTLDPSRRGGGLYRLDGTRVSGKPSARGLYINNGKKVVVK